MKEYKDGKLDIEREQQGLHGGDPSRPDQTKVEAYPTDASIQSHEIHNWVQQKNNVAALSLSQIEHIVRILKTAAKERVEKL